MVSVDGSREWWSRRSSWALFCWPMAVSTVNRLPPICLSFRGGGGGVSGRQSRVVESAEQLGTALLVDGSVLSAPAAAMCVGVGGGGVSVDSSREW